MPVVKLSVPKDFVLSRDACSYGYFLLAPNHWDPRECVLWRVFVLEDGPALVRIEQAQRASKQTGKGAGKRTGRRPTPGTPLSLHVSRAMSTRAKATLAAQVTRMLALDVSHAEVREYHRLDPRFRASGRARLFRSPTLFEDVIKTVTSCNVTWPNTINMNRRLCEVVGTSLRVPGTGGAKAVTSYAFPTPRQLARQTPARLRALCRVGYRDARIIALAKLFDTPVAKGGLDVDLLQDPTTSDEVVRDTLLELPGIGPYAAANIMQLLGRYSTLPLDTESVRHGRTTLGMKGSSAEIMRRLKRHYAPFGAHAFRSYWFEMWAWYESKHGKAWTWERETTGRMFTAALLNK